MDSEESFRKLWAWAVLVMLSVVFWCGFFVIGHLLWQVLS